MSRPSYSAYSGGPATMHRPGTFTAHNGYRGPADGRWPAHSPTNAGPSSRPHQASGMTNHQSSRRTVSANKSSKGPADSNAWMGCKLEDLPYENQRQIEQSARNMSSWENLAMMSIAKGESMPQTHLRETLSLMRAADNVPPSPAVPQNGPHPTPYAGSTYAPRAHNPPPNPGPPSHHHHRQQNHRSSPSSLIKQHSTSSKRASSGRAVTEPLDAWHDEVGVAWEDRFKPVRDDTRRASEGRSGKVKMDGRSLESKQQAGRKRPR